MQRRYRQGDLFTTIPHLGNPLAVVLDGDGLTEEEMERFTRWTNLSEATFLLPPTHPAADYRVRIFTSASVTAGRGGRSAELPFAGHPTLGSCHAWLEASGKPKNADAVIQECGVGLVPLTADGEWTGVRPASADPQRPGRRRPCWPNRRGSSHHA